MRVALVNALAWPDFASGATLQVHRLAVALRQRGHKVHLLAGGRRPAERNLSERRLEADGVAITSLNTEDYLGFSDRANFDNPAASERVVDWLDSVAPDVVHAHSLQGLGAGWFDRAAERRPVLVTMHDWWWICARQFLVREDMSIDAPLVDVAGCACSGGIAFNQERRAWLRDRIGHAARVLTPSAFLRDSLVANGFDAGQIVVDPNGVVATAPSQASASPDVGPPRLGYVGGWHEFKGLSLLLEARRRMPEGPPPLTISAWGAAGSAAIRDLPLGVEVLPEYAPDDTATVMRRLDALAVPSLMRESFSLVAHEALNSGVPVLASDSGGPEEVVRHMDNGMVIESGNPAAWAEALGRWSTDPELRARLKAGAARGRVSTADPAAQAAHMERLYSEALDSRGRPMASPPAALPPRLLILAGIEGAPLRYRAHHLAQAHRAIGGDALVLHHRSARIPDEIAAGGLVIFYRVPWSTWTRECVELARERGATVVFSVDDLIFSPELRQRIPAVKSLPPAEAEQWIEGVRRYQAAAHAAGVFLGSTPALLDEARSQGLATFLFPNGLGTEVALLSQAALDASQEDRVRRRQDGTVRIGYLSGTTTHDADWAMVQPAVRDLLARHPKAELWLIGTVSASADLAEHPRVRQIAARPYQELPRLHAVLDVVLAPLQPGLEFSEAKSAVKWIEAAAVGVPVIASPTGPFRAVIKDGITGVLAEPDGWAAAIERLAADPDARDTIGRAARAAVYRDHGPAALAGAWAETLPGLQAAATTPALPRAEAPERPTAAGLEPEAPEGYLDHAAGPPEVPGRRLGDDAVEAVELDQLYPNLSRIDVMTTTFGGPSPAPLEMRLLDDDGSVLRRVDLDPSNVADNGWSPFTFEPVTDSAGRRLRVELHQSGAPAGQGIGAWSSLDSEAGAARLCFRTWALPDRLQVAAVAMRRPLPAAARRGTAGGRRARVLWHKTRHSLQAQGLRPTAARVFRYGRRWWRGLRAS